MDIIKKVSYIKGLEHATPIASYNFYSCYYKYILKKQINICGVNELMILFDDPQIMEMECYPADGSIQWINDILIVKMKD